MANRYGMKIAAAIVLGFGCIAASGADENTTKLKFSGYFGFETEEIMSGRFRNYANGIDHRWGGNSVGNFTAEALLGERTRMLITLEGKWWLGNYPTEIATNAKEQGLENYAAFYIYQAQGIYSILKDENRSLDLSFGIIPYKYNHEAKNLGEYLFRSMCYPGVVFNNFDFPMSRLSGLRLNFTLRNSLGDFTADAFVISEREMRPFGDISLAGVVGYNYKKIVDFSFGAELYRLFSVNSKFTSPRFDNSGLYDVSGPLYDTAGAIIGYRDSSFYTFAGTKLMAHVTLDPLFFLRDSDFGRLIGEGGKIYGEATILGMKNYPRNDTARKEPDGITPYPGQFSYGYDTLLNKMPISFGINIPLPYIDVCALEFEYYRMRYPDNFREVFVNNRPLPGYYINYYSAANVPDNSYSKSDNWKWSLYLKKNINKNFHVVFQAARDHQRWTIPAFIWGNWSDWEDICMRPANWIWNLKGEVAF